MKKIVLSVMAVVLAPDGDGVTGRSTPVSAPDPVTPVAGDHAAWPGHGLRTDLPGALHTDKPVRLVRVLSATVH